MIRQLPVRILRPALIVALAAIVACGGSSSSPSSPSAAATLRSVDIACGASTLTSLGQTTQCRANANMSNGQTVDQTANATWSSSDGNVATVNAGLVTASAQGTTTIAASYQDMRGTQSITVDVPLSLPTFSFNFTRTTLSVGYRFTGTIDVTLNRKITPPPARVRVELENSLVGGSATYGAAGGTQIHIDVNQDTVACPNTTNTPPEFLRLIDVDRQVTLVRSSARWNTEIPCTTTRSLGFGAGNR